MSLSMQVRNGKYCSSESCVFHWRVFYVAS